MPTLWGKTESFRGGQTANLRAGTDYYTRRRKRKCQIPCRPDGSTSDGALCTKGKGAKRTNDGDACGSAAGKGSGSGSGATTGRQSVNNDRRLDNGKYADWVV